MPSIADATPKVIISASGMCDAGRIRHHLKHNLWRKECTILFVGYQAAGTLGRALLEGADEVRLFGEDVQVNAQIRQMTGLSGHADRTGLEQWIASFSPRPAFVFVNHGDDDVAETWAAHLRSEDYTAAAPYNGAVYELTGGHALCLEAGHPGAHSKSPPPPPRMWCAPARLSSGWSTWASGCWWSSSTTAAAPTRTWPSLPARSRPCATCGNVEANSRSAEPAKPK